MTNHITDQTAKAQIIDALKNAKTPIGGGIRTKVAEKYWIKPHRNSQMIVGYDFFTDTTYFHIDTLRHSEKGDILQLRVGFWGV